MFDLAPVRSLRPGEIMQAGMKVKIKIFANNRIAWPLVGFVFFSLDHSVRVWTAFD
jgi:hypothetical protein